MLISDRGLIPALLAALLIATTLPLARGVDVTGRCVAGPTTGTCANLAPFVWENATYTSANANATVNLFVANRAFLPQPCIDAGLPFLCAEAFKPCLLVNYTDPGGNNMTIGVPSRPCKPLCTNTNSSCFTILQTFNLLYLVQCDAIDADGAQYPLSATTYDVSAIDGTTVDVVCNNQSNLITTGNITCAPELFVPLPAGEKAETPYNVTEALWDVVPQYRDKCAIRCPNPQYGDDYWRSISIVYFVVCLLSLLCGCFTVFTFVVYPDRRKFPSILILHMTVATMIGSFAGLLSLFDRGDVRRVMCQNRYQFSKFGDTGLCTAQAFIFIFGQHGLLWWWLAIGFNMVALIVFRINLKRFYWAIVAFGWGPAFLFLFISIGLKDAAPGISWPFCTPSSDGVLYYPIGVLGSIGFLCSLVTIGWIVYITLRGNTDAKLKTLIARVVRPALFGLICAIPYAVVYAYRFGNDPAQQLSQVGVYLQCIIQGQGGCGQVPRTEPAFNYALSISLSCLGILTWACYSTHLKYFVDFKAWTRTRVTGLTTTLSSGGASTASKHSSRRGESDAWQRASSEADQGAGNASRF